MMEVNALYEAGTDEIKDLNGFSLGFVMVGHAFTPGDKSESAKDTGTKVSDLAALKGAGFTADEIMQMKREGLV